MLFPPLSRLGSYGFSSGSRHWRCGFCVLTYLTSPSGAILGQDWKGHPCVVFVIVLRHLATVRASARKTYMVVVR